MAAKPEILAFLCNWCSYAGADLAGTSRFSYPANVRPIRVMCSGRVDPSFIINAFRQGIDGVLVSGCHLGDCHYENGNYKTDARIKLLKKIVEDFGLEPERVRLEWISASEGEKFASTVESFVNDVRKLGPNPIKLAQVAGDL